MPILTCPICGKRFDLTATDSPPFCGKRCQQIDLRRWLVEDYAFPTTRSRDAEDADEGTAGHDDAD